MDSKDYSPGVYVNWFNANYWGEDSYNPARRIGWLVENWKNSGKPFDEENIILAGIPAKVLKHNIKWDLRSYGKYMRDLEKENSEEKV